MVGPTAVGKTVYAIEISKRLGCEIVSCDSMQIYKGMDIGSAKPTAEELAQVPHHLVDFADPREDFSVASYQKFAREAIDDIFSRGLTPLVTGGTGLYLYSIIFDMDFSAPPVHDPRYRNKLYEIAENEGPEALHKLLVEKDPAAASRIHPNNVKRVVRALEAAENGEGMEDFATQLRPWKGYEADTICLTRDRSELYERIDRRAAKLFDMGLIDEVKKLMASGLTADDISMKGIGYKEVIAYLNGEYDLDEAVRLVQRNSRRYAKRQLTWFRRTPGIKWYNISEYQSDEDCLEDIITWLQRK
ncbi:MAG: tRNA (adenosine(37)-N6)-dimethylallyltransferase MiaA [Eubacteriales bacterium]|nr:tRNA (adenosine(37)-N6)-dimethylallyltransferase MiaA [Eubacteriales bacterium]